VGPYKVLTGHSTLRLDRWRSTHEWGSPRCAGTCPADTGWRR